MNYLHNFYRMAEAPIDEGGSDPSTPYQQPITVSIVSGCDLTKGAYVKVTSRVSDAISMASTSTVLVYDNAAYSNQVDVSHTQYVDGTAVDTVYLGTGGKTYYIRVYAADTVTKNLSEDVALCGGSEPDPDPQPEYPADGTFIRNQCYGFDLYQVVADGAGGERQGALVEYNSATCNYVPPVVVINGCTDPEAENYNAEATYDNGTCTYAPKVFTEVKTIEVMPCTDGVCLRWFNNLGGIDTWVFQGKVDRPFSSEASGEFSLASGLTVASSKSGNPAMVLRASHLNYNRYTALWQLFTSPKVWLHHPDNSTEEVYVQPATLAPMPLGRRSYDLTVEVIKAPINSLRN